MQEERELNLEKKLAFFLLKDEQSLNVLMKISSIENLTGTISREIKGNFTFHLLISQKKMNNKEEVLLRFFFFRDSKIFVDQRSFSL